jgi:hypothetical protein
LTQQADEGVAAVLTRARIGEGFCGCWRQSKCIIEFTIPEQTGIGSHDRSAKLHDDATIKIEPKNAVFGFTRRVRHFGATSSL